MADAVEQLRLLVVQSAETAKLLGVDFIPMYSKGPLAAALLASGSLNALEPEPQAVPVAPRIPAAGRSLPPAPPEPRPETPKAEPMAKRPASSRIAPVPETMLVSPVSPAGWLPTVSGEVAAVRTTAQKIAAMDALRARYESDAPHQHFKTDHHNIVWGDGDIDAKLMFVGEAPGEEEDIQGRPFVGRSGQLLDKMIVSMGISRPQVYIANTLKTRPPGNATPTERETSLCAPYLFEQISIVSPLAIVTLGLPATRTLLSTNAAMGDMRGRWAALKLPDGREVPVMPTYHPAYVLRSYTDEVRGKVWSDLKQVMDRLGFKKPG
jgi:DNA polymerase